MDYETLQVERRGGELRITLDRPEAMNAWNTRFGDELKAVVEEAAGDLEGRAVTITGAGRAFSSGAHLKAAFQPAAEAHPNVLTPLTEPAIPISKSISSLPNPVKAAVKDPAVVIAASL